MSSLKRTCSMMMVSAMLVAPTFIVASPTTLVAQADSRRAKYDACIEAADESHEICLEKATMEFFCWSRYGYEKLGCTVSLGIRTIGSIFK
jgi:hypothetical protein